MERDVNTSAYNVTYYDMTLCSRRPALHRVAVGNARHHGLANNSMSYEINGRQFIVIAAGGSAALGHDTRRLRGSVRPASQITSF
jgi:hypothetical protein